MVEVVSVRLTSPERVSVTTGVGTEVDSLGRLLRHMLHVGTVSMVCSDISRRNGVTMSTENGYLMGQLVAGRPTIPTFQPSGS